MKTYLITGVSSGIGAAIAQQALAEGYTVWGLGRTPPTWSGSAQLKFVSVDLSDMSAIDACMQTIKRQGIAFDAVVSNAGAGLFGQLESLNPEAIRASIDLNLTAHILLARSVLPAMKRVGHGTLVFMGSESALKGAKNGAVYCAAKFGLRGLAQSLRADCARSGIRIAMVHPGMVDTNFFDGLWFRPGDGEGQALTPGAVAKVVLDICHAPSGMVIDEVTLSPQTHVVTFDRSQKKH